MAGPSGKIRLKSGQLKWNDVNGIMCSRGVISGGAGGEVVLLLDSLQLKMKLNYWSILVYSGRNKPYHKKSPPPLLNQRFSQSFVKLCYGIDYLNKTFETS